MRYKIENNNEQILIKSENAAKPVSQQNKKVLETLNRIPFNEKVLDYGCGKLRYTLFLLERGYSVTGVDSEIQVNRTQKIGNENRTSLKEISLRKNRFEVVEAEKYVPNDIFNWAICTNVMSAIPCENERFKVLNNIYNSLVLGGRLILTTQYRNSYFKTYEKKSNAFQYKDGWIISNKGNYTFYGLIKPGELRSFSENIGFKVIEEIIHDGSVIMILQK